jgi:uroporphyrin-III C-methyltransferase/precorrin-2 dehydrogenase/sirohydrochlorin ferrochelatase
MNLLPIFLKLKDARVLVVGGRALAQAKTEVLLEAGATVSVVAPKLELRIREFADEGRIHWHARRFEPADVLGNTLVFAATGVAEVDRQVAKESRAAGILCNAVDDPAYCDFYSPAVVRRGDLQIAISTNGQSPALAQQIRKRLEQQFEAGWAGSVDELGRQRQTVLRSTPPGEYRTEVLHALARAAIEQHLDEEHQGSKQGKVYFVGAGPGAADLLTVRAVRLLQQAEVVLHDKLVSDEVKALLPAKALVLNVGRRCGQPGVPREIVYDLMIRFANANRRVVRLKCGDPAIFARLGEEMDAMRAAGVNFEIIPGVTAGLAAAAAAQISLTDRRLASNVVFTTANLAYGQQDWNQRFTNEITLVIYMPGRDFGGLAARLVAAGASPQTPCAVISRISTPAQEVSGMMLEALAQFRAEQSPSIVIVGEVVGRLLDHSEFLNAGAQIAALAEV